MKIKILALVVILLAGSLVTKAGNDELSFKQTVITKIQYPEFAKEQKLEADVWVSFTVTENGEITVNQTNSIEPDLMDYVKAELKKIKVNSDNEVIGKTFVYRFTFKYQE
jgi:hypothetical protein